MEKNYQPDKRQTDIKRLFDRRDFIKKTSLATAFTIGSMSFPAIRDEAWAVDWKPISFPRLLFHNFRYFDNIHNQLQKDQMLVIEGERIKDIVPSGDLGQFSGFKKIDLQGRTLLPGMIDNHVHISLPFISDVNLSAISQADGQVKMNFKNCIMGGVTTVRDVGGFPEKILKYKEMADADTIPGPSVISSLSPIAARQGDRLGAPEKVPYFTNPIVKWLFGGNYAERPTNTEEIKKACDSMIEKGAQWLKTLYQEKSYSYYPRNLPNHTDEGYCAILEKGRQHGLKCALHEPFVNGFKKGVDLGFHTLEHMPHDGIIPDRYIESFIRKDMAMLPTMLVYWDIYKEEELLNMFETRGEELAMPEVVKQIKAMLKASLDLQTKTLSKDERRKLKSDPWYFKDKLPNMRTNLQKLYKMGATIGIGTDLGGSTAAVFGRYVDELEHFSEAGIPNFDILCQATSINAKIIDKQDQIGLITKGKIADLIAVSGNPLENLDTLRQVDMVMKKGLFIKAKDISLL